MIKLHFDGAGVRRLIEHARNSLEHRAMFDEPSTAVPGLWLVGDNGVYLMSNGLPPLVEGKTQNVVVHARECNPNTMESDDWWPVKNATFGGDDGVELLTLEATATMLLSFGAAEVPIGFSPKGLHFFEMVLRQKAPPAKHVEAMQ